MEKGVSCNSDLLGLSHCMEVMELRELLLSEDIFPITQQFEEITFGGIFFHTLQSAILSIAHAPIFQ
jgi:hypothetical protein